MDNKVVEKKICKMCGKKLPEQDMFKKIRVAKDMTYYICCEICYEQFSGKPFSGHPDIKYK